MAESGNTSARPTGSATQVAVVKADTVRVCVCVCECVCACVCVCVCVCVVLMSTSRLQVVLHLRGPTEPETDTQRKIQWAEDTVDNEGMGRKSSKCTSIVAKPPNG
jgi:hypothetical protein